MNAKYHSNKLSIQDTIAIEKFFWGSSMLDFSTEIKGYKETFKGTPREFLNSCGLECIRPSDFAFWIARKYLEYYSTLIIEDYVLWSESKNKYLTNNKCSV